MLASIALALAGSWAGVLPGPRGGTYAIVDVEPAAASCKATLTFPRESEAAGDAESIACDGDRLTLSFTYGGERYAVEAEAQPFALNGTVSVAGDRESVTFLPLRSLAREQLLPYTGDFARDDGRTYVFAESLGKLYYFDRSTGRTGRLYPLEPGRFFGGPSWLIYQPTAFTAQFTPPENGESPRVDVTIDGKRARFARVRVDDARDVRFSAPSATIAGTLRTPRGTGPFPAVLIIAGSNGQPRSGYYAENDFVADQFVRLGFATLTFDKRGVGASTGAAGDDGAENVAAAAFAFLRSQAFVDPNRVGIWGISQGGIIAPKVASLTPGVAFIINCSGAVVDANTQEIERTALQLRADGFSERDVDAAVAFQKLKFRYAQTGQGWDDYMAAYKRDENAAWFADPYVGPPDSQASPAWTFWRETGGIAPAESWRSFTGPVLLTYGEHEVLSDPLDDAAAFVQAMREANNQSYAVVRIPGAEHSMLLARNGGFKEARMLTAYSLPYFRLLGEWLQLNGVIAAVPQLAALGPLPSGNQRGDRAL